MDSIILKALAGAVALVVTGCSLVVDTSECVTDSDCSFGDSSSMQCVSNECVPVTESTAQQLVPSEVREDLVLGGDGIWVFAGVSVISPHAKLVVGEVDVEIRDGASIALADSAELVCDPSCPELLAITRVQTSSEAP